MNQLAFDEETAKKLEVMYRARDVVRRRALVREALGARAGERVIDVGCGPGFYVAELLEEVGPEGSVLGVDAAEAMLAVAAPGTASRPGVTVLPAGFEHNLLCGVANRRTCGLGLALLQHINFASETVTLLTPVPAARIRIIQCGELYISPEGHELARRVPRGL